MKNYQKKIDCKNLVLSFKWKNDLETYVDFDRIKDADKANYSFYDDLSFSKLETREIKETTLLGFSRTYTETYDKELYSKLCFSDKAEKSQFNFTKFSKIKRKV